MVGTGSRDAANGRAQHDYGSDSPDPRITRLNSARARLANERSAGLQVEYDVFVDVPALDARNVSALRNVYDADDLDYRLRRASAAVRRRVQAVPDAIKSPLGDHG